MRVVKEEPKLECALNEFYREYLASRPGPPSLGDLEEILRGQSTIKPRFRIPSADLKGELFFDSFELLRRWANMPTPSQSRLATSFRVAMKANMVNKIQITIPWSKASTRSLLIKAADNPDGPLDFELI